VYSVPLKLTTTEEHRFNEGEAEMGIVTSMIFGDSDNPRSNVKVNGKIVPLKAPRPDYEAEGLRIMESMTSGFERGLHSALNMMLGELPTTGSKSDGSYHDVDVMWTHPESGGILYVGNDRAAKNDQFLRELKVTSIVNCTRPSKFGQLPDYHKATGRYRYYDLPIGHWDEYCLAGADGSNHSSDVDKFESCLRFLLPAFAFCLRSLKRGDNVLVHCLAGAHRAGTMGILSLMHLQGLNGSDATNLAKHLRPVIQPISDFPQLISLFEKASRWRNKGAMQPCWNQPLGDYSDPLSRGKGSGKSGSGGGGGGGGLTRAKSMQGLSYTEMSAGGGRRPSIDNSSSTPRFQPQGDNRIAESLSQGRRNSRTWGASMGDNTPVPTPRNDMEDSKIERRPSKGQNAFAAMSESALSTGRDGQSSSRGGNMITLSSLAVTSSKTKTFNRRKSYAFGDSAYNEDPNFDIDAAAVKMGVELIKAKNSVKNVATSGKRHSYN